MKKGGVWNAEKAKVILVAIWQSLIRCQGNGTQYAGFLNLLSVVDMRLAAPNPNRHSSPRLIGHNWRCLWVTDYCTLGHLHVMCVGLTKWQWRSLKYIEVSLVSDMTLKLMGTWASTLLDNGWRLQGSGACVASPSSTPRGKSRWEAVPFRRGFIFQLQLSLSTAGANSMSNLGSRTA